MDEADAVRTAAREAIGDVVPAAFRDDIGAFVADGSAAPGVLTLLATEAVGADTAAHTDRAVGVQLIYDGLRLTRRLADDPPWLDGESERANVDVLAADVLVARGFSLLAETDAAADAVGVVQAFGHTQTERQTADGSPDRELEADVLELALVAGAAAGGTTLRDPAALAAALVDDGAGLAPPEELFDATARERIAGVTGGAGRPLNRND